MPNESRDTARGALVDQVPFRLPGLAALSSDKQLPGSGAQPVRSGDGRHRARRFDPTYPRLARGQPDPGVQPERALPIYTVNELGRGMEKPVPTELESLLQRLLEEVQAPKPGITDLETLLQGLFPGILAPAPLTRPGPIRRDWATIMCFSCGKAGHVVGRCPELNETFPFMLPGWSAERMGSSYVMISPKWPRNAAGRKTGTDPGRGSAARISNGTRSLPGCGRDPADDSTDITVGGTMVWCAG